MAENNLTEVADGDIVGIDDINQSVRAFKGNVVPRNTEGVATTRAGSLGTESLQWDDLHVQRIVLAGEQLEPGAGGAGGAGAPLFENGVVSGMAPTNRPGMCGWLLQAGTGGVRVVADAQNPLVVRVGGQEYSITSGIVGGSPLPTVVAQPADANWEPVEISDNLGLSARPFNGRTSVGMDGHFLLMNGNPFAYGEAGEPTVPSEIGDLIIFSYQDGTENPTSRAKEYFMFERAATVARRPIGQRAIRAAFNDSSSGYRFIRHDWEINDPEITQQWKLVTPGYVFLDPTSEPPSLFIQPRVLGTTAEALPTTATAGQVIYRQTTQKWYNFEGAAWVEKEWVFLGIAAIENVNSVATVVAVAGVRSEAALRPLYQTAELIHAPGGTWDRNRQAIYDHTVSGTLINLNPPDTTEQETLIEERSPQAYLNQRHELLKSRFQIDADEKSTIRSENGFTEDTDSDVYCIWVDAFTRETFADDSVPVIISLSVGRAFLAHQHKNAVLIGSFLQNRTGDTPRIPTLDFPLISTGRKSPTIWHESISVVTPPSGGRFQVRSRGDGGSSNRVLDQDERTEDLSDATGAFQWFSQLLRDNETPDVTIRFGHPNLGDISDKVDPA